MPSLNTLLPSIMEINISSMSHSDPGRTSVNTILTYQRLKQQVDLTLLHVSSLCNAYTWYQQLVRCHIPWVGWGIHSARVELEACKKKKKTGILPCIFSEELRNISISILNLPRGHETPSEDCDTVPAHLWSVLLEFSALLNEPFSGLLTLILPVCQYCCGGIKFSLWGDQERKSKIIICNLSQEG